MLSSKSVLTLMSVPVNPSRIVVLLFIVISAVPDLFGPEPELYSPASALTELLSEFGAKGLVRILVSPAF